MGIQHDVLVAGGGPIGSYSALALARRGHRVLVFERQAEVGQGGCCTGIVGKECLDRFPDADNAVIADVSSARLISPSGGRLLLRKDEPQARIVDRGRFDRALAGRAQREGAEYLLSARVVDVTRKGELVEMTVEHGGKMGAFAGQVAVIASGFGGQLTQKVGLGRPGDSVLGIQARVAVNDIHDVECYFSQSLAPGFFAWLVPTSQGQGLAGLLTRRRPKVYLEKFLSRLLAQGRIISFDPMFSYGGVPLLPLRRCYAERIVAVGDAAGHCKPTTGGGIYYGLLGAEAAAAVLDGALRADDLSAKRLSRYDGDWRTVLAKELSFGYIARRMYENLSDKQVDRLFEMIERSGLHEQVLRSADSSFDWHAGSLLKALRDTIRPRPAR